MRETAHAMRVDNLSVPYRYATRAFLKFLVKEGQLEAELKLRLLLNRFGYRNCVAEYAADLFVNSGMQLPLECELDYDAIGRWADAKKRITILKHKRIKHKIELTSEQKAWRETGNKFRKNVEQTLAKGRHRGKIEVALNKLLSN